MANIPVIDIHCHPSLKINILGDHLYKRHDPVPDLLPAGMHVDLPGMQRGGVRMAVCVHYLPEAPLRKCARTGLVKAVFNRLYAHGKFESDAGGLVPFQQTMHLLDTVELDIREAAMRGFDVKLVKNYAELMAAWDSGSTVIAHSIEGAHSLGRGLSEAQLLANVDAFAARGVCQFTIAHFFKNDLVDSQGGINPMAKKELGYDIPWQQPEGLNPANGLGEKLVRRMLDLGIIIDLVHTPVQARKDIYAINRSRAAEGKPVRPLVFAHTGIRECLTDPQPNMPQSDKDCLPDAEEVLEIRRTGGVIGIIFMNYWLNGREEDDLFRTNRGIPEVVRTMKKVRELCGDCDNITIGTDLDGMTQVPDDLVSEGHMPQLLEAMRAGADRFTEEDIQKITSCNYLRVLRNGWGTAVA